MLFLLEEIICKKYKVDQIFGMHHARAHLSGDSVFGSWTCATCTFQHTGPAADFLQCSVCLAQRQLSSSVDNRNKNDVDHALRAVASTSTGQEEEAPLPRNPPTAPGEPGEPAPVLPPRPKRPLPSRSMSRRPTLVIFDLDRTLWDGDIRQLDPQGEGSIHATRQTPEGVATAIRDSRGVELQVFANALAAVKQ